MLSVILHVVDMAQRPVSIWLGPWFGWDIWAVANSDSKVVVPVTTQFISVGELQRSRPIPPPVQAPRLPDQPRHLQPNQPLHRWSPLQERRSL